MPNINTNPFDFQTFDIKTFDIATWDYQISKGYDEALLATDNVVSTDEPQKMFDIMGGNVARQILEKILTTQEEKGNESALIEINRIISPLAYIEQSVWYNFLASLKILLGKNFKEGILEKNRRIAINIKYIDAMQKKAGVYQDRVIIELSPDIHDLVFQAEKAIFEATPGALYQKYGQLVKLDKQISSPYKIEKNKKTLTIIKAEEGYILQVLSKASVWMKYDAKTDRTKQINIPINVVKVLSQKGDWPFYPLYDVINSPIIKKDGEILSKPGYDFDTAIYFEGDFNEFNINENPTKEDAVIARKFVLDLFQDFPFKYEWGADSVLAAILTILARYAINGEIPAFIVSSPTPGSGKGRIVDIISMITDGEIAARWMPITNQDEERKRLATIALSGEPIALIDNCQGSIGNQVLNAVITSRRIKERAFATHREMDISFDTILFFTGNNLTYEGDFRRRIIEIYIEPPTERPEERNNFEHDRIVDYTAQNRSKYLGACLTIISAYIKHGMPRQNINDMGSFEEWSNAIRGAIVWAGGVDPNAGKKLMEAQSSPDAAYEKSFVLYWEKCFNETPITTKSVIKTLDYYCDRMSSVDSDDSWHMLRDAALALTDKFYKGKLLAQPLDAFLMRIKNRIFDNKKIVLNIGGTSYVNGKEIKITGPVWQLVRTPDDEEDF